MKHYVYVKENGNGYITCFDGDEQVYTFTIYDISEDHHHQLDDATSEDLRNYMNRQFV